MNFPPLTVVIPAAGIGKRMQANTAKQYLPLQNKSIIEHTIERFTGISFVETILVVLSEQDEKFVTLPIAQHNKVKTVIGGKERADSVLNGLRNAQHLTEWVMVHDAARPCVNEKDIINLYQHCIEKKSAGILASPVRDTMKRGNEVLQKVELDSVKTHTVDRNNLWHGLTPQCALISKLISALELQLNENNLVNSQVTDEASALELAGENVLLVQGSVKNIKITMPEDLELAEFYLNKT